MPGHRSHSLSRARPRPKLSMCAPSSMRAKRMPSSTACTTVLRRSSQQLRMLLAMAMAAQRQRQLLVARSQALLRRAQMVMRDVVLSEVSSRYLCQAQGEWPTYLMNIVGCSCRCVGICLLQDAEECELRWCTTLAGLCKCRTDIKQACRAMQTLHVAVRISEHWSKGCQSQGTSVLCTTIVGGGSSADEGYLVNSSIRLLGNVRANLYK